MTYKHKQYILSQIKSLTGYSLIAYLVAISLIAGEHFIPTVKYLFILLLSYLPGSDSNYPDILLHDEAFLFMTKSICIFLCALTIIFIWAILFTPIIGLAKSIEKLLDSNAKLSKTLREKEKDNTDFINFSENSYQYRQSELASRKRLQQVLETFNIEVSNARHSVHNLNLTLKQLKAIVEALANDLSPPDKSNQGGF